MDIPSFLKSYNQHKILIINASCGLYAEEFILERKMLRDMLITNFSKLNSNITKHKERVIILYEMPCLFL
jgi:hypothetical protein